MIKIVISNYSHSLDLSDKEFEQYLICKGVTNYTVKNTLVVNHYYDENGEFLDRIFIKRDDPCLIEIVEKNNDGYLKVVEISDNVKWEICTDDFMVGEYIRCQRGLEPAYDVY